MVTAGQGLGGVDYDLGVDLGTTYTAAAIRPVGGGPVRVVPLEARSAQVPSVLLVDDDGGLLVGSAAEARAPGAPQRVVREFKRRLGDETPIVVAGTGFSADGVAAEMVRWVADHVARLEGRPPRRIAVTHPAGWGAYRRRVFADAIAEVGLPDVVLLPEPEAAAVAHAAAGCIPAGHTAAVYDLGGGTFDAAVVTGQLPQGVTVLGRGQGIEALGGIDFDEALFWHVCGELGGAVAALDPTDPATVRAVAGLRRACVAAKEALSVDTEATVTVELPNVRTRVRVTRGEFEEMIEPALRQTVDVLFEVMDSARVRPELLDSVLLIGGSSRIPLVAQVLARALGRPVAADPDPTTVVARGAALAAGGPTDPGPGSGPAPVVPSSFAPLTPLGAARPRGGVAAPAPVEAAPRMHPVSGPLPAVTAVTDRVGALAAPRREARTDLHDLHTGGLHTTAVPRPRHAAPEEEDEPVTVELAMRSPITPARPPLRRGAPATAGPLAAPAPVAPASRRRTRIVAGAVGGGLLLLGGGVVAVTVPMVSGQPAPQSAATALPAPAAPAAPAALPPAVPAPAAAGASDAATSDVTTVARTGSDTADTRTTTPRRTPRAAATAPPAVVPPATPAPARVVPPAAAPAATPVTPPKDTTTTPPTTETDEPVTPPSPQPDAGDPAPSTLAG